LNGSFPFICRKLNLLSSSFSNKWLASEFSHTGGKFE
jgi:hypothetical protein